jgi:hypothetical protein
VSVARVRWLTTVHTGPALDPSAWADALAPSADVVPIINLPVPAEHQAPLRRGLERLVMAGASPLAQISLGYATRPVTDVVAEIMAWARYPVTGVFFDHAPSGPYQVGPVVVAVRTAQRLGLTTLVLNAGVPVDPVYRRLDATVCTFEGSWTEYVTWCDESAVDGDGHIVFDVPVGEFPAARGLIMARRAGLALVSARATAYPGQRRAAEPTTGALWTASRSR